MKYSTGRLVKCLQLYISVIFTSYVVLWMEFETQKVMCHTIWLIFWRLTILVVEAHKNLVTIEIKVLESGWFRFEDVINLIIKQTVYLNKRMWWRAASWYFMFSGFEKIRTKEQKLENILQIYTTPKLSGKSKKDYLELKTTC